MKFKSHGKLQDNISYECLLDYLSQIIITKFDEDLKLKHQIYEKEKSNFSKTKTAVKETKLKFLDAVKELARMKVMVSILTIIDTLRKEGALFGERKRKIILLLNELKAKNFKELRMIEKNLHLIIPNNPKITNY